MTREQADQIVFPIFHDLTDARCYVHELQRKVEPKSVHSLARWVERASKKMLFSELVYLLVNYPEAALTDDTQAKKQPRTEPAPGRRSPVLARIRQAERRRRQIERERPSTRGTVLSFVVSLWLVIQCFVGLAMLFNRKARQ